MDPRTLDFILFAVFSVGCLLAGHAARERRWVREEHSRGVHLFTVIVLWSIAATLSLWKLPIEPQTLWLVAIEPVTIVVPAFVMFGVTRALGVPKGKAGVLSIAAGISNSGFTLGAYVCFTLLPSSGMIAAQHMTADQVARASESALAYAVALVMIMAVCVILFLFPLARYCSDHHRDDQSLGGLIVRNLLDLKAMNLYASILGVSLAAAGVRYPGFIDRWHILQVLIYLGAAGAYFGIGLRLHLGHLRLSVKPHLLLAAMKFGFAPVMTFVILTLASFSPAPPTPLARDVFLMLSCMPAGIQTVVTANIFHLDARFATAVWVISTAAFVVLALPVLVVVAH